MNDFIRKMFDDDENEVNVFPKNSPAAELTRRQGQLYEQLQDCLEPGDREVLDKYAQNRNFLSKEEQLIAFRSGLRCAAEFFIGIFSD